MTTMRSWWFGAYHYGRHDLHAAECGEMVCVCPVCSHQEAAQSDPPPVEAHAEGEALAFA